mmetsp:Transcript_348/g.828  ORF Transcript_348/g.828 Transcript_348/m.828 type:complete len:201 (-) Transcript_348:146-748(-)
MMHELRERFEGATSSPARRGTSLRLGSRRCRSRGERVTVLVKEVLHGREQRAREKPLRRGAAGGLVAVQPSSLAFNELGCVFAERADESDEVFRILRLERLPLRREQRRSRRHVRVGERLRLSRGAEHVGKVVHGTKPSRSERLLQRCLQAGQQPAFESPDLLLGVSEHRHGAHLRESLPELRNGSRHVVEVPVGEHLVC